MNKQLWVARLKMLAAFYFYALIFWVLGENVPAGCMFIMGTVFASLIEFPRDTDRKDNQDSAGARSAVHKKTRTQRVRGAEMAVPLAAGAALADVGSTSDDSMDYLLFHDDHHRHDSFDDGYSSLFEDGVNPASGLPMMGMVDVAGNPYGTDMSHDDFSSSSGIGGHDDFGTGSGFDDWSTSGGFDDSFGMSGNDW